MQGALVYCRSLPLLAQVLVWLALGMTASALVVDVLAVWQHAAPSWAATWSAQLRFWRTVACAGLCLVCLSPSLSKRDSVLLASAMLLCVPADFYLVLMGQLKVGIAIFLVVQLLLVARHLQWLRGVRWLERRHVLATAVALGVFAAGNALLHAPLSRHQLSLPVMVYSFFLLAACLSAFLMSSNPQMPATNARLAFSGMVLFVLCDITVGIGAAFKNTFFGDGVRALTGLFYTPSLLMLALSARRG